MTREEIMRLVVIPFALGFAATLPLWIGALRLYGAVQALVGGREVIEDGGVPF